MMPHVIQALFAVLLVSQAACQSASNRTIEGSHYTRTSISADQFRAIDGSIKGALRSALTVRFDEILVSEDGSRLKVVCGKTSLREQVLADEKKAWFVAGFENGSPMFKLVDVGEDETEKKEVNRQFGKAGLSI